MGERSTSKIIFSNSLIRWPGKRLWYYDRLSLFPKKRFARDLWLLIYFRSIGAQRSGTIKQTVLISGLLFVLSVCGCAASQAAHQIQEGRLALITGKPEIAAQHFERAVALDSKSSDSLLQESAWTYLGRAYYGSKNYSLARQALDRALAQNNDEDMARLYLGLIGVRGEVNEISRQQVQAGLQGVYNRVDYIKRFTASGQFWDRSGQLSAELKELIKEVSAQDVEWNSVIPRIEQSCLKIEDEFDQARRDVLYRYRGGDSSGGEM